MTPKPISILLVEDDELFRLGLSTRLKQESTLEVTAEAEDGETAIALVNQRTFDIVILDIGLPGIGGIEACQQIKQQHPDLPVLALTSHNKPALIARLIEAKAQGYCVKGIPAESLVLAIRSIAAGATWWDAVASKEIQTTFQTHSIDLDSFGNNIDFSKKTDELIALTKREQEILGLMVKGQSNQEIADTLFIAPGTVRVHVHAILQKLEVRDRTQAVVLAIQKGLLISEID
ncbi:response regulator transcription factor [Synechocystis sp. PCC 6714]|uniref:response regulator transcription factor n=1 Tax=Synechocystis sp. (strain PCC 6714) TaxID=1147 RepID=UPI0004008EB3|nr:response regulator transcription factor [Synechocystis sp. PCC 6714]AIE76328.1 Two-component response regulator [Synechocystis sp. PCC 6714]